MADIRTQTTRSVGSDCALLNKHMNNKLFLTQIYTSLQTLGLVETQDDLSRLCGRAPAYISSIKARNIPLSTSAALALRMRIDERISKDMPRRLKPLARQTAAILDVFAQDRSIKRDWH